MNGLSWEDFTPGDGQRLASESLRETAASYKDLLMYSTVRSESGLARMERILVRSIDTLQYQLQQGLFIPEAYEFSFGEGSGADAITFPLEGGRCLRLVGRIDRLDLCREDGSIFVKILDYKSGSLDLDEELMRRGIQLQLLMYMEAVMRDLAARNPGEEIVPSAMLYYRITDPVISAEKAAGQAGSDDGGSLSAEEAALKAIRAELRPTGLVHSDPASYRRLDRHIDGKSAVIPLTLKKTGNPAKDRGSIRSESSGSWRKRCGRPCAGWQKRSLTEARRRRLQFGKRALFKERPVTSALTGASAVLTLPFPATGTASVDRAGKRVCTDQQL